MTKKDILAEKIMTAYLDKKENSNNLKFNSDMTVLYFIKERLIQHGNKGYYFHTEYNGRKRLYQTCWSDISHIVNYVFESNSFTNKEDKLK